MKQQKQEYQFQRFLDILKQVHINLPLVEAFQQMTNYAKYPKDIVTRRTLGITKGCMAILHNKTPPKQKDPGSFTIPYTIGNQFV